MDSRQHTAYSSAVPLNRENLPNQQLYYKNSNVNQTGQYYQIHPQLQPQQRFVDTRKTINYPPLAPIKEEYHHQPGYNPRNIKQRYYETQHNPSYQLTQYSTGVKPETRLPNHQVLRPKPRNPSSIAAYNLARSMNSGTSYSSSQNVQQGNIIQSGNMAVPQQHQQHLQGSTSPYSTSPQPRGSYPNSPHQHPQGQYMPQKSERLAQTNEILALLEEKIPSSPDSGQPQQQQVPYQAQSPQLQQTGYANPQDYSQSPPNLLYYPYHKDFLNSSQTAENTNNYSVKLPSGVIHQYPAPDYAANSPPQVPLPDYPSTNGYNEQPKSNVNIQNPSYVTSNNAVYQQHASSPNHLPDYGDLGTYIASPNNSVPSPQNQYNQVLTHKQEPLPKQQNPPQTQNQEQLYAVQVSDYNTYRSNTLDSPQGSPMPVNASQASPNVYNGATGTPPLQRKTQPARQISNEIYSNVGSPSNHLLLGNMSLNSPRPRSETVDMEAPTIPPRSPNEPVEQTRQAPTFLNPNDVPALNSIPPQSSSQVPTYSRSSVVTTSQQPITSTTERRLRSGTVEMVDAATRQMPPPPPGAAPSQRYLPSNQLNMPQRSRAGTVEMVDSLSLPERRIRSGTVEMTEVTQPSQQSNVQQPMPPLPSTPPIQQVDSQRQQQISTQQQQQQQYIISNGQQQQQPPLTEEVKGVPNQVKSPASSSQQYVKSPPPYPAQVSSPQVSSAHSPVYSTVTSKQYTIQQQTSPAPATPTSKQQAGDTRQNASTPVASYPQSPDSKHVTYVPSSNTTPLQHLTYSQPQQNPQQPVVNQQNTYNQIYGSPQQVDNKYITDQKNIPAVYYKNEVNENGRSSLPQTQHSPSMASGLPSPSSQLENLKLSPHQQKVTGQVIKQEYNTENQPSVSKQYTEQEQKVMQQQYMQRVRQAQLQQQLRQLQNEYEDSLQVEQDIAQEFLREQELNGETYRNINNQQQQQQQTLNTPYHQQQHHQHQQQQQQQQQPLLQQQLPPSQASYQYYQQPSNVRNYPDHVSNQQYTGQLPPSHMAPSNQHPLPPSHHQQPSRMPYSNKEVPVFPVTGLPINQSMYPPPPRMQYQQQPQPPQQQQQKGMGNQPILIMPGGVPFSNPGQYANTTGPVPSMPPRGKAQQNAGPSPTGANQARSSGGGSGKQPTPFQKLRKIAEEISSFVDDVVKFTGKKGDHEYKYLEEMLTQKLLLLDKVAASGSDELRNARKALVKEVQELLEILERRSKQKH